MIGHGRGWCIASGSGLALVAAIAVLAAAGCGDGHQYPEGFAAKAALDEKGYVAAEAAKSGKKPGDASTRPADSAATPSSSQSARAGSDSSGFGEVAEAPREALAPPAGNASPSEVEETGQEAVASVVEELRLPPPPPVPVSDGTEPYQTLARDRKFAEFRSKAARYVQLKKQLLPYGRKLAEGTATPAERALHNRIEIAMAAEFKPLNAYLWDSRWTEADRAAMGWILFVKPD